MITVENVEMLFSFIAFILLFTITFSLAYTISHIGDDK